MSLALLGVIIGRILGIPWYATFTAGAPALAPVGGDGGRPLPVLSALLPPELALAVGIPLGALVYLALLRRFMPDGLHKLLAPLRR